jgi:hypothetical protein
LVEGEFAQFSHCIVAICVNYNCVNFSFSSLIDNQPANLSMLQGRGGGGRGGSAAGISWGGPLITGVASVGCAVCGPLEGYLLQLGVCVVL